MIEKIWPVNKLVKLRQEVTELRQETIRLRREAELLNHQFQRDTQRIEERCRSLSAEIKDSKADMVKSLEEIKNSKEDILRVLNDYKHENHEDL
jgi:seryl-tRNA synthetase